MIFLSLYFMSEECLLIKIKIGFKSKKGSNIEENVNNMMKDLFDNFFEGRKYDCIGLKNVKLWGEENFYDDFDYYSGSFHMFFNVDASSIDGDDIVYVRELVEERMTDNLRNSEFTLSEYNLDLTSMKFKECGVVSLDNKAGVFEF